MEEGPEPQMFTISVLAMQSFSLTGDLNLKNYLSIIDGPKELQTLLHMHARFEEALREAQRVLGTHGVDRITVLNDPANEDQCTTYGTSSPRSQLDW